MTRGRNGWKADIPIRTNGPWKSIEHSSPSCWRPRLAQSATPRCDHECDRSLSSPHRCGVPGTMASKVRRFLAGRSPLIRKHRVSASFTANMGSVPSVLGISCSSRKLLPQWEWIADDFPRSGSRSRHFERCAIGTQRQLRVESGHWLT